MIIDYNQWVENDLREVIDYYDSIKAELSDDFLDLYEKVIDDLVFMPERFPIIEANLRQVIIQTFPYLVYYRIISENHIRIIGVKHQKRNPDLLRSRE